MAFCLEIFVLNNNAPITPTINGVSALITPAKELDSWVCAVANKKAGIKLPKKPMQNK